MRKLNALTDVSPVAVEAQPPAVSLPETQSNIGEYTILLDHKH